MNNSQTLSAPTSDLSKNVVMNHLNSFLNNDLNAVVSDYTDESVLITQEGTYRGIEAIKSFFVGLIVHFPKKQSKFDLDKLVINEELIFIVWHARTPSLNVPMGSDTFIIRNGKIVQQTFVGQLVFMNL
jgi:hypothetical protein